MEAQEEHGRGAGKALLGDGGSSAEQLQQPQEPAIDFAQLVVSNNTKQLADWFLHLKQGDVQQTHELLRGIISKLPMRREEEEEEEEQQQQLRHKRARSEYQEAGPPAMEHPADFEVVDDFVAHDEVDEQPITAVILVPNDIGLVSHVIGKQGVSVQEIKRRTGARVQVERTENIPSSAQDRNVYVLTDVKNATIAVQMIMKKVTEKLPATAQTLRLVVPNELVSKIIGKGGAAIKKLQSDSGATVQVAKDLATDHVPVGRNVVLTGNIRQIALAHYNVMRMLVMDKEFPADWRGGIPLPFNAPRPPMSQPPHPPGAPMMPAHPTGSQRGRMGMQPQSAGMMAGPITYAPIGPAIGPPPMMPGAAAGGAAQSLTRFETVVPEYSVSYIIGKKGSYVNEIQRTTSTNIEVAKTSENGVDRRVTIVGSPDGIQRATRMLEDKVRDWQSRAAGQFHAGTIPAPYATARPPLQQYPQQLGAPGAPGAQTYPGQQPYPGHQYTFSGPYPGQQQHQQPQQPYSGPHTQPPPQPYPSYGR